MNTINIRSLPKTQRAFEALPMEQRESIVRQADVLLNLDVRQYGLGGNSCGPTTLAKYEFDPNEPVSWTLRISPVK